MPDMPAEEESSLKQPPQETATESQRIGEEILYHLDNARVLREPMNPEEGARQIREALYYLNANILEVARQLALNREARENRPPVRVILRSRRRRYGTEPDQTQEDKTN